MSVARQTPASIPALPLRPPEEVMTPEAMSAFKASRLSFLRSVIRRMVSERWRIDAVRFDLDDEGRGTAVYRLDSPDRPLHFVVFSDKLPEDRRTDRIIENRYDGEALLCVGDPLDERIAAQRGQFADFLMGRADIGTLGWTRVNRSGRIFDAVVDALAEGRQPDREQVVAAGYLMRNNGFWGNGRHGSASFQAFEPGEFLATPYHADLLTLFMWRHFSHDLVEHIAHRRNPAGAVPLAPHIRRFIGVGNASGLGLVPFVVRHPLRLDHWIRTRETAIARVKAVPVRPTDPETGRVSALLGRAIVYYGGGVQVRPGIFQGSQGQASDLKRLRERLAEFRQHGTVEGESPALPWRALCAWAAANLHREGLELLHSLLIEVYPRLVADLERQMVAVVNDGADVRPGVRVVELADLLHDRYDWALDIDLTAPGARRHFWYLSHDNLEPRHGLRSVDPGEEFETFVDIVGEIQRLADDLEREDPDQSVGAFLFAHPQHRQTVERVQSTSDRLYGEVRANILAADFEPCHLIRFLLTLYGMEKLDPQSRLWVRGTFLQGAPTAEDIAEGREGDWIFPMIPGGDG